MTAMRALILAFVILSPAAAFAQGEWKPVKLSDMRGTADYHYRENGYDFLGAQGDFDGDKKPDTADLVTNSETMKWGLLVRFGNGESDIVATGPLKDLSTMAVSTVEPGLYLTTCTADDRECQRNLDLKTQAVSLFQFEGPNRYIYFTGKVAHTAWISE